MDLIVKLLIILFTLAVGTCFTSWPEAVVNRFDRWSGRTVRPAVDQGAHTAGGDSASTDGRTADNPGVFGDLSLD
jgi:hypothetical protein